MLTSITVADNIDRSLEVSLLSTFTGVLFEVDDKLVVLDKGDIGRVIGFLQESLINIEKEEGVENALSNNESLC